MKNEQAFTTIAPPAAYSGDHNQLDFAIRQVLAGIATTTLVQVKAVRPKDGGYEVDAQPMVAQVDGAGNAVEHGTIHSMPVWRVQGGTSAVIVEPAVGDIGVAVFCSSDVSGVKRTKAPATPGSYRKFDWGDGIYLGGVLGQPAIQQVRIDGSGITLQAAEVRTTENFRAGNGASGSFTSGTGQTVEVTDGIITNIF